MENGCLLLNSGWHCNPRTEKALRSTRGQVEAMGLRRRAEPYSSQVRVIDLGSRVIEGIPSMSGLWQPGSLEGRIP